MLLTRAASADSLVGKAKESSVSAADTAVRWIIVALLFGATTLNYLDRAVLGILKPMLDVDLGWTQIDYGWMVTAFHNHVYVRLSAGQEHCSLRRFFPTAGALSMRL
jgi:hypothetical protein